MINIDKEYTFEEILAMLPAEGEKNCIIDKFLSALEFIKTAGEFGMPDLQRYLKCGYGDTCRVIDALVLLGAVEKAEDAPEKYKVKRKGPQKMNVFEFINSENARRQSLSNVDFILVQSGHCKKEYLI